MIRSIIYPIANRLVLQPLSRITRGMTLGVRAIVRDEHGRFLVVRQSYTKGWVFPGGGVERGEAVVEALKRELVEETATKALGNIILHGLFSNHANYPGDYVAVYLVETYEAGQWQASLEISARDFLTSDEIAADCSPAMLRRLDELAGRAPVADIW